MMVVEPVVFVLRATRAKIDKNKTWGEPSHLHCAGLLCLYKHIFALVDLDSGKNAREDSFTSALLVRYNS